MAALRSKKLSGEVSLKKGYCAAARGGMLYAHSTLVDARCLFRCRTITHVTAPSQRGSLQLPLRRQTGHQYHEDPRLLRPLGDLCKSTDPYGCRRRRPRMEEKVAGGVKAKRVILQDGMLYLSCSEPCVIKHSCVLTWRILCNELKVTPRTSGAEKPDGVG